jgi:putative heme-binding domain-containing protein
MMTNQKLHKRIITTIAICCSVALSGASAEEKRGTTRPPWTTSRIQGSPEAPAPFKIVPAFPGVRFKNPTCIEEIPGTDRLLVAELGGKIYSFVKDIDVIQADLVVDLSSSKSILDADFHPGFRQNRLLFVSYIHSGSGRVRVSRFTVSAASPPTVVPGSEQVVITWPAGPHTGGCLEFGTDGFLYASTGDGAGPNPPDGLTTGQDISDLLGSILRIDVDRKTGTRAYTVPADNPFVDLDGARPEVWAYGLRNPWKFGVDPATGDIFAADNGWESWEMVHRIVRGGNGGWPRMEARAALRTEVEPGPTPILPPVKDHPHSEANSVIGGPVYRGAKLPELRGAFVYGDYITGTIWAIHPDEDDSYSHTTLVDTDQRIVAFTQGHNGELWMLDYDFSGQVYEVLPSGDKDTSAGFPRRLGETGLFKALADLEPAPGVVPYTVQAERWTDGAQAQRWVAIPGDGQIRLSTGKDDPASYPEGTVFVKQLNLPQGEGRAPIRLETQILWYEKGKWQPASYLWDDAGQEAHLAASIGSNRPLRVTGRTATDGSVERTWHVSATNECKLCHNAGSRFVLGFSPHQLNRFVTEGNSIKENQLRLLAAQGALARVPSIPDDDPSRLVDPHDPSLDLDDRARSYLHANCGSCHHPRGNAIVSFYLDRGRPFSKLNTFKGTGIGTFGMRNAKIIAPGDPYRSVLMYRMSKTGYSRMPYIGSQLVDSAGVSLIGEWIRSLPKRANDAPSPPATAGSAQSRALRALVNKEPGGRDRRDGLMRQLVTSTEGTLALVTEMHRGSLSAQDFDAAVLIGRAARSSDIRGLFETFVSESQRRTTLGSNINPESVLSRGGDQERGKLIFFSDGARCRACHEIEDRSKSLGPTLKEMNKKYPRPSELLQHVLQPSLKIEDPFAAYVVVTIDGRVETGLLVEKNDKEIVLRTAERKTVRIARGDIDELQKSPKSLMPERMLSDLTAQEAADLFAYIRSQGPGE